MFTGIVETTGKIISLKKKGSNLCIGIESTLAEELRVGQSVAHNGICLTIESTAPSFPPEEGARGGHYVTAVKETLQKTNLASLKEGSIVNLERSLKIGDRLDGHFVQGHVDTTATCLDIKKEKGSTVFTFGVRSSEFGEKNPIIDKGSICINGVSLTIVNVFNSRLQTPDSELAFSVTIIPHTFRSTNFSSLKRGGIVNIEFDVLGKYIFAMANQSFGGQKIIQK